MAFFLVVLKLLIEIAGCALLAQFMVGLLASHGRNDNFVYRLLQIITSPATRLVRWVTPNVVVDRHIPLATFLILVFAWMATVYGLAVACAGEPHQPSCTRLQRGQ